MRSLTLLAFLLIAALPCCAQTGAQALILRGRLGSQPVVMRLERGGDKLTGTYQYERVGQDLKLTGRVDARGQVALQEFDAAGRQTGQFTGQLDLTPVVPSLPEFDGQWKRPDGTHEQTVSLWAQHRAFANAGARFVTKTLTQRRPDITVAYPQLTGLTTPGALAFNRAVAAFAAKQAAEFRQGVSPGDRASLDLDYNVTFASDDLVSVELTGLNDYGGAHPNTVYESLVYDLRAGRAVEFAALFKRGADYDALLERLALADMNAQGKHLAGPDDEPFTGEGYAGDRHAWGLAPRGLVLYYSLPQVAAVFDKVVIPWRDLQPVLNPQGPAARLAQTSR
ncbi:MAG TPA: hypothetical protein VF546_10310 [Pyrinomonadaceae bacterium]|jgi:hypothetical protein